MRSSVTRTDVPIARVRTTALAVIEEKIREVAAHTLATADEQSITPLAAALQDGRAYFAQATGAPDETLGELFAGTPAIGDRPKARRRSARRGKPGR